MSTLAHPETVRLAKLWEAMYPSAVFSGIVGDPRHMLGGGYHISIEDQPGFTPNYSVMRPDDKAPPGTWPRNLAAGVDMSMSTADMIVCHNRLKKIFFDRADPRRVFLNGWNGWDGSNGAGRYDIVANTIGFASDDHKWHIHLEIRRRWVTSRTAMDAILSVLAGASSIEGVAMSEWAVNLDPKNAWALTQGNPGYAGQQRDTALAFAWESAAKAREAAEKALTELEAIKAKLEEPVAVKMTTEEIELLAAKIKADLHIPTAEEIAALLHIPTLQEIEDAAQRGAQRAEDQ